jgi:hypothetical protein
VVVRYREDDRSGDRGRHQQTRQPRPASASRGSRPSRATELDLIGSVRRDAERPTAFHRSIIDPRPAAWVYRLVSFASLRVFGSGNASSFPARGLGRITACGPLMIPAARSWFAAGSCWNT